MREILFRGKRKDNGKWVCGFLYVTNDSEYEISNYCNELNIERYTSRVIPKTVGQFTGLTDKNGRKIFEGDIVNGLFCFGLILKSVVHFKDGVFGIVTEYMGAKRFDGFNTICNVEFEVIGNIHDNPELLEVSK